jgi:serine/threonine protein phosphatase PrpC
MTTLYATRPGPAGLPECPACTAGTASQGPWSLAWTSVAGSRHAAAGKPCEDSLAHRFHPGGVLAAGAADGVSGGALGEVASSGATSYCVDWTWPSEGEALPSLQDHVGQLDGVVRRALARHTARSGATTLAAVWLQPDGTGWLCQVGDVRAYLWTPAVNEPGTLECITRDQTYNLLGELPPPGVPGDNPARLLGNGTALAPALQPLQLAPGQTLLLCTDGLHGFVTDRELAQMVQTGLGHPATPARMAQTPRRLLRRALQNQSDDDIAVMLLTRGG